MNRLLSCLTICFLLPPAVYALQPMQVDYYGAVSTSSDVNMIKMAQDLFYSQLKSIENVTVTDRRNETIYTESDDITFSSSTNGHIVFYAEISEETKNDGTLPPTVWNCTLNAINPQSGKKIAETETYDSYYKILVSAKTAIESVLNRLTKNDLSETSPEKLPASTTAVNTEMLAGTWNGEQDIDKIVILRGGRGFVIFRNGASMTISVNVTTVNGEQFINITQTGKPNASYYPSLPRETALEAAESAHPITWTLQLISEDVMSGKKSTLIVSSDDPNTAVPGTESVIWKKK